MCSALRWASASAVLARRLAHPSRSERNFVALGDGGEVLVLRNERAGRMSSRFRTARPAAVSALRRPNDTIARAIAALVIGRFRIPLGKPVVPHAAAALRAARLVGCKRPGN